MDSQMLFNSYNSEYVNHGSLTTVYRMISVLGIRIVLVSNHHHLTVVHSVPTREPRRVRETNIIDHGVLASGRTYFHIYIPLPPPTPPLALKIIL